ncbi:hypothetical protein NN561_018184 [Cricetulus griseus]
MQPPGPPPAYAPANGDFTFVSSADAEGETRPGGAAGQGWRSGDSAPVPAGPSPRRPRVTREGAGRGLRLWASPPRLRAGSLCGSFTSDPPIGQGFLFEMYCSKLLKSEGSKNENKVGPCSSAINRKASPHPFLLRLLLAG